MTTPPLPDPLPIELLAAYVDGELDADARAAVERWLHDHPEALEELVAQRELSPHNTALWDRATPPEPAQTAWNTVQQRVADAMTPLADEVSVPRRGWRVAALLAGSLAVAAAAAIGWLAFGPLVPRLQPNDLKPVEVVQPNPVFVPAPRSVVAPSPRQVDPLASYPVLAIATDADVVLNRVPEFPGGWLPVGQHPFPGVMVLASEEEVLLAGVSPSPVWPVGMPKMTTAPGDAPMIFAHKPR